MKVTELNDELDLLKLAIRKNPEIADSIGERVTELSNLVRTEVGELVVPGGAAAYCHSHCGSHCNSHPQERFGLMSRIRR